VTLKGVKGEAADSWHGWRRNGLFPVTPWTLEDDFYKDLDRFSYKLFALDHAAT